MFCQDKLFNTYSLLVQTLQARKSEMRANPPARQPSTMYTTLSFSSSAVSSSLLPAGAWVLPPAEGVVGGVVGGSGVLR